MLTRRGLEIRVDSASRSSAWPKRTLRKIKRCEDKIRYGTAIGAKWSLWGIWFDRYLRGKRRRRERRSYAVRIAVAGTSPRSPSDDDDPRRRHGS